MYLTHCGWLLTCALEIISLILIYLILVHILYICFVIILNSFVNKCNHMKYINNWLVYCGFQYNQASFPRLPQAPV